MDDAREILKSSIEDARRWARSPEGREMREKIANALIVATPIAMTLPIFRRTRLARLIELGGGAALVVKAAEWLRDWESGSASDA